MIISVSARGETRNKEVTNDSDQRGSGSFRSIQRSQHFLLCGRPCLIESTVDSHSKDPDPERK